MRNVTGVTVALLRARDDTGATAARACSSSPNVRLKLWRCLSDILELCSAAKKRASCGSSPARKAGAGNRGWVGAVAERAAIHVEKALGPPPVSRTFLCATDVELAV
jgi:hypothetical protein